MLRQVSRAPARIWSRISFSVKFPILIFLIGAVVSVIPLGLTLRAARIAAGDLAADKAAIAASLVQSQERSLQSFANGLGREIDLVLPDTAKAQQQLVGAARINQPSDVVGITGPSFTSAVQGDSTLAVDPTLTGLLSAAARNGWSITGDGGGTAWLVESSPMSGGERVFIARPVNADFMNTLGSTIGSSNGPADLVLVKGGSVVLAGRIGGSAVGAGTSLGAISGDLASNGNSPAVGDYAGQSSGFALGALSDGYALLVSTPVQETDAVWPPVLLLVLLIVVAMAIIFLVVRRDLQLPLRRLDRAVAALARDEYDVEVPHGGDDEIGRLGTSFNAMRLALRATLRGTLARAAIATELNAPQPLEGALAKVCRELRSATGAQAACILVSGSEMTDSFAVTEGTNAELDVTELLNGDGPIGAAHRHPRLEALEVGATRSSAEARLGLHEFCGSPLRMGRHTLGVLAVAKSEGSFLEPDAALVASAAEQVALALERYRFLAMVQRQASIDDLTGLHNHRFLVDYLGQQVALAERLQAPLAVLMLDIDHFKRLNDTHGHQAGDIALRVFAETLTGSVRRADLAARYGGEEFMVVMTNTNAHDAERVAEKIRAAVAEQVVDLGGRGTLSITVSIGCAAYPEDTRSARELLSLADSALYMAKGSGRNRVCTAGSARAAEAATPLDGTSGQTPSGRSQREGRDVVTARGRRRSPK